MSKEFYLHFSCGDKYRLSMNNRIQKLQVMKRELILKDPKDENIDENNLLKQFPVYVWISPVETTWKWGQGTYFTQIEKPGK